MLTALQQKQNYLRLYNFYCWINLFAVMTVLGPLLPLFCNALRMSKTQIGFILALLPLSYLVSVFVSRWITQHGPKKIVLRTYFARYFFIMLLPLAPWVGEYFGQTSIFAWVALMLAGFAVLRSIADAGWWVWVLELVPDKARGKVDAFGSMAATIGSGLASLGAVLIMRNWPGIAGYSLAMYVGVIFGYLALAFTWRMPGGGPLAVEKKQWVLREELKEAFANERFKTWLKGVFCTYGFMAVFAFLPLYLSDRIGFTADKIMLFSACCQAGILASAFFWGWSADRFGSKPVFMSALTGFMLVPVFFYLLARLNAPSLLAAGGLYALFGIFYQGILAGQSRYLFVTVLAPMRNPVFCSSLTQTVQSLTVAGCSFFCGWLLDVLQPVRLDGRFLHFDNFTVLFVLWLLCCWAAVRVFRRAPDDSGIRTGQFVSFFMEGNPLLAFSSILRYHLANDEVSRMDLTRRMGDSQSRLTVQEILQSADDPNFNVRYEAIISMARMPADPRLINALALAVRSREPGVSEAACWALGRMGDSRALPVLREMLKCEYALLRSQCARALAKLNDAESVPDIIAAFRKERNHNVGAGFAAALGRLRRKEAFPDIVALLRCLAEDRLRGDVALAAARIAGGEHHFVRLWKRSQSDFETACAEELMELEKKSARSAALSPEFARLAGEGAKYFEQRNSKAGAATICALLAQLSRQGLDPLLADLLGECEAQIRAQPGARGDYIVLALNALHLALVSLIYAERKKKLLS